MADPYLASNEFPGDGITTLYNISFKGNRPDAGSGVVPYLNPADVKAQVITPATATTAEVVVDVPCVYVGPNQFRVTPATPVGKVVRIYRATQDEYALVDYQALQTVGEADLDLSNRQVVFIVQEAHDLAQRASVQVAEGNMIAQEAVVTAQEAVTTSESAVGIANNAVSIASTANTTAGNAVTIANSATSTANNALVVAQAAQDDADAAVVTANGIAGTANTALAQSALALSTANGIAGTANTALAQSATALSTANSAAATANGIAGTANTALVNANQAVVTANQASADAATALSTANGIAGTANTALTNSNNAVTVANAAQPGDPTLTALAAVVTAANKLIYADGTDSFVTTDLTSFARTLLAASTDVAARATLGVVNVGQDYLSGLTISYVGAASVNISTGCAVIQSTGQVLHVTSTISLTGMSIASANTFYHLYLYNNAGTPAVEVSTTAPVSYFGNASSKSGDTSRRYIGTLLTGAASNLVRFTHSGDSMRYAADNSSAPFNVLSSAVNVVVAVSCASVIPVTAHKVSISLWNNSIDAFSYFMNPDLGTLTTTLYEFQVRSGQRAWVDLSVSAARTFSWSNFTAASANTFGFVYGYLFRR